MHDGPAQPFLDLINIVARLRAPDGCPWDRKQTPASFKSYLIEETHELAEAIDHDQPPHIMEELGDLLFQVVFLARLYEEAGHFTISEVIAAISEKMIRRHPHVFGDQQIDNIEDQRKLWLSIKASENDKSDKEPRHLLRSIPQSLPALRRAQRVSERAAQSGFEWPDLESILAKLQEEISELRQAKTANAPEQINEELGDLLLTVVNLGRYLHCNTEEALQGATEKFIHRFIDMEKILARNGTPLSATQKDKLLTAWEQAKNR